MKRIIAIVLTALVLTALLCACGQKNAVVTTSVAEKYDDGYAKAFADSSSQSEDGKTVYQFNEEKYEDYRHDHNNVLSSDMSKQVAKTHGSDYGEYVYINEDKQAVIVGVHTEKYKEDEAKAEAPELAEYGFKYFQNLQNPVNTIKVIYANANNQSEELGVFEFTAE